jgi:hypothetical protein
MLTLPQMALSQIAEVLTLILDRIATMPTPWLESLSPLITWLSLHKGDALITTLFHICPTLKNDLARIHKICAHYCTQEFKGKGGKHTQADEDAQTRVASLIGSTLLPEEFFYVGFLPIQSYIDNKKVIGCGSKCPPEKENVVRAVILRNHLEDIGCTFEDLRRA